MMAQAAAQAANHHRHNYHQQQQQYIHGKKPEEYHQDHALTQNFVCLMNKNGARILPLDHLWSHYYLKTSIEIRCFNKKIMHFIDSRMPFDVKMINTENIFFAFSDRHVHGPGVHRGHGDDEEEHR